jgi:ABC-type glycerol-3-phosphate transport system substrate-binding protein
MSLNPFTRKAVTLATVLTVSSAGLLAGCGASSEGGDGAKQLTYWSEFTKDEPEAKVLLKTIQSFEKDTGVKVKVQWQGRDVLQKVTAALNTNDVPDIVDQADNALKGLLVKNGQARDLTDLYETEIPGEQGKTIRDVIPDKYDQFTTYEGKQYMAPVSVQAYAMWYDGKKLPEVAKQAPKTWAEFETVLKQLKAKGDNPLALDNSSASYNEYWIATAIVRALGPGALHEIVEDKTGESWKKPEVEKAAEAIASLAENDYFQPGYDSSKWPAMQKEWAQGNSDLLFLGGWVPNETATYAKPGFEYRAFNFPSLVEGGDTSVPVALNAFVILKKAKNGAAAEKFISYFYNKDRFSLMSSEARQQTPRPDIEVPAQLADIKAMLAEGTLSSINDGVPADFPDFDTKNFQPMSTKLMSGQVSAKEFVTEMAAQQKQYWKLNG